ncbi:MAG: hypothetical protein OJJ54_21010 [Pseudonocardia sp.]|nr:hypothetical protein [Pseudonocardia sp.]
MDKSPAQLVRCLVAGDPVAVRTLVDLARTGDDATVLVAAALVDPAWTALLDRAAALAANGRERQLVAVAAAYLRGDPDRADLLVRDHLADHPDSLLAAHIAGLNEKRKHR